MSAAPADIFFIISCLNMQHAFISELNHIYLSVPHEKNTSIIPFSYFSVQHTWICFSFQVCSDVR
jgi:hypothetical protein